MALPITFSEALNVSYNISPPFCQHRINYTHRYLVGQSSFVYRS